MNLIAELPPFQDRDVGFASKRKDFNQMRKTQLIKIMMLAVIGLAAFGQRGDTSTDADYFFTIQIASFKQEQSAMEAVDKLKQKDRDVFYRPIQFADKGTWYRLYINRYATIQSAQTGIIKLRKQGIIADAYIRRLEDKVSRQAKSSRQKPQALAKAPGEASTKPQPDPNEHQKSENTTIPELGAGPKQRDSLKIRDIFVRLDDKDGDRAYIQADRYFWPVTHLSQDGGKTKLQVQIRNTDPFQKDISPQASGGRYIQNGQVTYDADRDTLVLSLDLPTEANCRVTQLFNQAENIFSLLVTE